ncbi:MAG: DUF6868 family protein [Thermodesulfobacteriota bacterium]
MLSLETLTAFFGWCLLLNLVMLSLTTVLVTVFKEPLIKSHLKLFGMDREKLEVSYFQYLGNIKVGIFMLNLMPYLALKLIA